MHYWRKDSFDGLESLYPEIKDHPRLSEYACYIDLLGKGLRKEALKHIEDFLSLSRAWDKPAQREVTSFLCRVAHSEPIGHRYVPQPVWKRLIEPTLKEWIESSPEDPEPLRWTGEFEDLKKSLRLDPNCDQTRYRLVHHILRGIQYDTHELPYGFLGVVEEDLKLLDEAEEEAQRLSDPEKKENLLRIVKEERSEIQKYQAEQGSGGNVG